MTIDKAHEILEECMNELPDIIFKDLNGGVVLLPQKKISPEAKRDDLYTMGVYERSYAMGRSIKIYYGSFVALYGEDAPDEVWRRELRNTLKHELTHHLEDLAGEKDLEVEDEVKMWLYKNNMSMSLSDRILKKKEKK